MPTLARASPDRELERLIRLYLRAETDIINEIGRLRSQGLVDYHAVAALERVQAILRQLEADDWEYVPRLVEAQFYVRARMPELCPARRWKSIGPGISMLRPSPAPRRTLCSG